MAEHIVAVFRTNEGASAAARDLETAGIPATAIRQYAHGATGEQEVQPSSATSTHQAPRGFWAWLSGEESETTHPTDTADANAYDRTTAAGNVVLSVTVHDDSKIHQAITTLEAHHPIDIDEHADDMEASALAAGSTTHAAVGNEYSNGAGARAGTLDSLTTGGHSGVVEPTGVPAASPIATTPTTVGTAASTSEEVIPLSEEQLEVGKRTVDRGTTRIRRYVVEKPVEESVTLHGEKVTVERRRPIAATGASGAGAFEERVVEVRETMEEPVVAKTAHVVEEVVVGREATERTETVRDTVRREEVEVTNAVDGKR